MIALAGGPAILDKPSRPTVINPRKSCGRKNIPDAV